MPQPSSARHVAERHIEIAPDWLDFGPEDPLDAAQWINACTACGETPALGFAGLRWCVRCDCGQQGTPGQLAAIAAVNWNKSPLSLHPHYQTLPFFALDGLIIPKAREKLIAVREYLEEQKRRCERRIRARENFGHRYFQRVRAYLAWAIYAQGLVREAEIDAFSRAAGLHAQADDGTHGAARN